MISYIYNPYTDQLSISITSTPDPLIGEGGTIKFTATASGITNNKQLMFQWRKNHNKQNLPEKASGGKEAVLTITNLVEDDEGKYDCIVTNEWGNRKKSNVITLTVKGNCITLCACV